jgi:hypothetical protein
MLEKKIFFINNEKNPEGECLAPHNEEGKMSRARVGDVLGCEVCGLKVIVDEECGCATIDIICCEEPMVNLGPAKPKKIQAMAAPKKNQTVQKVKTPKKKPANKKMVAKQTLKKAAKKSAKKMPQKGSRNMAIKKAKKK